MKIAVVGAGISGASAVKSLLTHPNFKAEDTIDVFEPRETLGVGLPYVPSDDESIRLNVSADILSVVDDNPNDFVEWLEENIEEPTNFENLVSRPSYGKYLEERFSLYFNHEQVQHIQTTVTDMEVLDAASGEPAVAEQEASSYIYRLKTNNDWVPGTYDAVFFAVGHPPYNDYYDLKGEENYIHHPYPMNEKLADIDIDKKIGIVGSGATGIDLMRYFHLNHDLKHPLTFYDPNPPFNFVNIPFEKELPFTFSKEWIAAEKEKYGDFIPFERMLEVFYEDMASENVDPKAVYEYYKEGTIALKREAFEKNDQNIALLHTYSGRLVPMLPYLFNVLSGEDKAYYLKNYHKQLSFFKARVPNLTYKWLFELMDAGKLRAVSGLSEIDVQDDKTFLVTADGKQEEVDLLINASGFTMNIEQVAEEFELIHNLYDKEIILPHKNGNFLLVDWPQTRVLNQRFGLMKNLFFFGLLIGGTQHENNDAALIIEQSAISVNYFMDNRT